MRGVNDSNIGAACNTICNSIGMYLDKNELRKDQENIL